MKWWINVPAQADGVYYGKAARVTEYSRPEKNTERRLAGIVRKRIRDNPCAHCVHRIEGWGRVTCSLAGRRFPQCTTDGRALVFELDESTVKRAA